MTTINGNKGKISWEEMDSGKVALLLALTSTREEEEILKEQVENYLNYKCVVTEAGGKSENIREKISNAVLGAALSCNLIEKRTKHIHALFHAMVEAKEGFMLNIPNNAHVALKIAVVREPEWIVVALYGKSAMHVLTNHSRAGLGVMNI